MKFIAIFALIATTSAIKTESVPHSEGSPGPCDNDNYMSVRRCKETSECAGGDKCEFINNAPIGWCAGPTACPAAAG